ncbi:hypothetical protein ILUMI_18373, partial [Ignelater luminosus]
MQLKNKDGEIISDEESKIKRWAKYFEEVLNTNDNSIDAMEESTENKAKDGLRQGRVLHPTFFITIMDDILKEVHRQTKQLHISFRNLKQVK